LISNGHSLEAIGNYSLAQTTYFLDAIERQSAIDRSWELQIAILGARGNEKAIKDMFGDLDFEARKRNAALD
jgi:hypothetical protein